MRTTIGSLGNIKGSGVEGGTKKCGLISRIRNPERTKPQQSIKSIKSQGAVKCAETRIAPGRCRGY